MPACSTCPKCGYDLEQLELVELGDLRIIAGSVVQWKGQQVRLSQSRVLMVKALAGARGAIVSNVALAEAIGYDGNGVAKLIDVNFCHIRKAFRKVDPAFDHIERGHGNLSGGGARWKVGHSVGDFERGLDAVPMLKEYASGRRTPRRPVNY